MLMISKKELRRLYKSVRKSLSKREKELFDLAIFIRFVNSELYKNSQTILIYVSVGYEVSTENIIRFALENGKRIAVPRCENNEMQFFEIKSFDDLSVGTFGIPTVKEAESNPISDFSDAVCVVPGLSFDRFGNRLGYGGGYYDRYLADKKILAVGLGYERCISTKLFVQDHDIEMDYIITEKMLRNSKKEASTYG